MPYFRIFIGLIALACIVLLAFKSLQDSKLTVEAVASEGEVQGISTTMDVVYVTSPTGIEIELAEPNSNEILSADEKYVEKVRKIEEERRRQEEEKIRLRLAKIEALKSFLVSQGSPMAPYAELILGSCEEYGSHYCKFFLSIAGVESGFGRADFGTNNAWGWGRMKFASWEQSIPYVADEIASNYYLAGCDTYQELAYSPYGPQNPEAWIKNLYFFHNQMTFL